jgi:2'-5' RNA ligase
MTICVYLRPEERICSLGERYARELGEIVPTSLTLGADALAHITLVHLDGVDDKVDEIWRVASESLRVKYEVEGPFYLSAIPFPDGSDHNYVRLEVSRSDAFQQAQQRMLDVAAEFGASVSNLAGPAWRPHVTLAVVDRLPVRFPLFPDVVGGDAWTATLAIGTIGTFRHVDRMLHTL